MRVDECSEYICFNEQLLLHNSSQHCRFNITQPQCNLLGMPIQINTDPCCPLWRCPCKSCTFYVSNQTLEFIRGHAETSSMYFHLGNITIDFYYGRLLHIVGAVHPALLVHCTCALYDTTVTILEWKGTTVHTSGLEILILICLCVCVCVLLGRCSVISDLRVITFDGNNVALYDNGSYILVHLPRENIVGHVEKCPTSEVNNPLQHSTSLCL